MQTILNDLNNRSFLLDKKIHKVMLTKIVNGKAVIKTNIQSFVKLPSEMDAFFDSIVMVEKTSELPENDFLPSKDVVHTTTALQQEIIYNNAQSRRVTDRLEDIFNELSSQNKISEETYKKAKAMVDASNAIVNMQMVNYKFLALK